MPPRHQTLPQAKTESAREAQMSFYCELCNKGYTRMNDYEAHLSSYDHSHKQRMKDMKQMVKDPAAIARARKQEQKADGIISIKIGEAGSTSAPTPGGGVGGGFRKGGFKKTGFVSAPTTAVPAAAPPADTVMEDFDEEVEPASKRARKEEDDFSSAAPVKSELVESDTDDEGYEAYDPRFPTD